MTRRVNSDSALFGGVMYDTSGVYVDTLQAQAGCDSIATLNLTIKESKCRRHNNISSM